MTMFSTVNEVLSQTGATKNFFLALQNFCLKNGLSNHFLNSVRILKTPRKIEQKILDILANHKLDLANISTYLADIAGEHLSKIHSVYTDEGKRKM